MSNKIMMLAWNNPDARNLILMVLEKNNNSNEVTAPGDPPDGALLAYPQRTA